MLAAGVVYIASLAGIVAGLAAGRGRFSGVPAATAFGLLLISGLVLAVGAL